MVFSGKKIIGNYYKFLLKNCRSFSIFPIDILSIYDELFEFLNKISLKNPLFFLSVPRSPLGMSLSQRT